MADYDITKDLKLDLSGIPEDAKNDVKDAVGEYLLTAILNYMQNGESPVSGEKAWDELNEKYAEKYHGGDKTPRLELTGDMKAALSYEFIEDGIKIGILDSSESAKADGHNKFSGEKSNLPRRRFIPGPRQTFDSEIMNEVENIIQEFRADIQTQQEQEEQATGEGISFEFLSGESLEELLFRRLTR